MSNPAVRLVVCFDGSDNTPKDRTNVWRLAELETLPRIGPMKAQAIVDYRTAHGAFATVDDLDKVTEIGPATVEAVRALATLGPP